LRGFFDSEGEAGGTLRASNGDIEKLNLVRDTLESLRIRTTGPHLKREKGGFVVIKGRRYRVNKNQYYLYVRTESRLIFHELVGFSIGRKMRSLESQFLRTNNGMEPEMAQEKPS